MTRRPVLALARVTAQLGRRSRVTPLSAALVCALTGAFAQPAAAQGDISALSRVRSTDALIAAVIDQANERSATFRRLVATINASDGLVYVEEGKQFVASIGGALRNRRRGPCAKRLANPCGWQPQLAQRAVSGGDAVVARVINQPHSLRARQMFKSSGDSFISLEAS